MIDRHESCIGIRLFKSSRWFIQLWVCMPNYEIKPHSHDEEDIELMYILGKTTFYRKNGEVQSFTPKWYNVFRKFSIPAGTIHWFTVSNLPLIFINFAKFKQGIVPKSASIDFQPI